MFLFGMLGAGGFDTGLITFISVLKIVFISYIGLGAIAMIVLILMQPSNSQGGITGITGTTETYYSHNKGATKEGRMKRATAYLAISILLVAILFFVVDAIYTG